MDDLKLYPDSQEKLHTVNFSNDNKTNFGFDKCNIINIKILGIPQNQHGDHSCLKIFTVQYRKKRHKHLKNKLSAPNHSTQ